MLNTVTVANETIDEIKKKKTKYIIVKVDYVKAYDSIRWNFLLYDGNIRFFHKMD